MPSIAYYILDHILKFMPAKIDSFEEVMANSLLPPGTKCLRALSQIK